jgi:hypothetical protein
MWCWLMVLEEFCYSGGNYGEFLFRWCSVRIVCSASDSWCWDGVMGVVGDDEVGLWWWAAEVGRWLGFWVVVVAATVFPLFSGGRCTFGYWWCAFGGLLCLGVLVLDVFPFLLNGSATLALYTATFVLVLGLFVLWGAWLRGLPVWFFLLWS